MKLNIVVPEYPKELQELVRMREKLNKEIYDIFSVRPQSVKQSDPIFETKRRIEQLIKTELLRLGRLGKIEAEAQDE